MIPACPHCESVRRIPIVYGNMRDMALDLADRGFIALGGSTFIGELETWECTDCWTRYGSRTDHENELLYLAMIKEAFDNYETVSLDTRLAAKALRALRLITVRLFELGITEARIESTSEGNRAMVEMSSIWQETSPPPPSLLRPITWLVENHFRMSSSESAPSSIQFDARIAKMDKKFILVPHSVLPFVVFAIRELENSGN